MEQRRHALRKLSDGDWLCLSNDQAELWRFTRYAEDGSAEAHGRAITGDFWMARSVRRPTAAEWRYAEAEGIEVLDWITWDAVLPTRTAAIDVMLRQSAKLSR